MTERINIFFPPSVFEQLREIAKKKGISISGLVRSIVIEYLKKA